QVRTVQEVFNAGFKQRRRRGASIRFSCGGCTDFHVTAVASALQRLLIAGGNPRREQGKCAAAGGEGAQLIKERLRLLLLGKKDHSGLGAHLPRAGREGAEQALGNL